MNIELRTSAGIIKAKPMKRKELNRLSELLDTITNSTIIREEVERDALLDNITERLLTQVDKNAIYCIPSEEELFQVLRNWFQSSEEYYSLQDLTKELNPDTHEKPEKPPQSLSEESKGREFIRKILTRYRAK